MFFLKMLNDCGLYLPLYYGEMKGLKKNMGLS